MQNHGKFLFCLAFLILINTNNIFSQQALRIRVESGFTVPFHINSLKKYENGDELRDWTRIAISANPDSISPMERWSVKVKASDPQLIGDYGRMLNLEYISIQANLISGDPSKIISVLPIPELIHSDPDPGHLLIEGEGPGVFIFLITYEIGKNSNVLLGQYPDYYFFQLYFDLSRN